MMFNAESIKSVTKQRAFQEFIYREQLDIVVVCETWLYSSISDLTILPTGYNIYQRDREHKAGGGVLIAVKTDISSLRRKDIETNCEVSAVEFSRWHFIDHLILALSLFSISMNFYVKLRPMDSTKS